MKYHVSFQKMGNNGRPIDHPSRSDHSIDESGLGMLPNVGDYVQVISLGDETAPAFEGRVRSRLFRYFGASECGINIVVEENDSDDWGSVIKE